uniref:Centrosomal protein POC5 n=1 Tax=Cyprinus carpio TaxID=7962 RepID=A0A8C1RH07_CYPCA
LFQIMKGTQTTEPCCQHPLMLSNVLADRSMFISEENLNKMENILDTWSTNLKSNVMMELRKWKLAFVEQHRLQLKKEREKHAAHMAAVNAEMDALKDLLNTYKISNQRKDEVIVNLSRALDRQREKLELMRSFTQWRLQQCAAREEGARLAEQHYHLQLKRKVWAGWHSLIQNRWQERVQRACCARAEDVCMQLSTDYEAKMAQVSGELQKAQAEIHRLHTERERYEDSMKKAFMRGVCALNIEALGMFNTGEAGRLVHGKIIESPIIMESPIQLGPSHNVTEDGEAASTRIVTAGKQKASKTVTARLTGRTEHTRMARPPATLHVMGVAPPMSSVVVERHHPVTQVSRNIPRDLITCLTNVHSISSFFFHHFQLTVGQATAAKFPRSALQSQTVSSSKSTSSQPRDPSSSTFHIHSIKVVD